MDVVGRSVAESLVRALRAEPGGVGREVGLEGPERAVEEEPARVLGLEAPPEAFDEGDEGGAADGAEAVTDAAAPEGPREGADGELRPPVGHDRGRGAGRPCRVAEEPPREGGSPLAPDEADGQDLPREGVDHGPHGRSGRGRRPS